MAISKKTAADYVVELENAISSRNADYDTRVGPIADLCIQPTANVLELQNDRIRQVQQLLSLANDESFVDDDLDALVFNENIVRLTGSRATVTLVFSRSTLPTSDITIKANFPVATLTDESSGLAATFLTIDDVTLPASNASAYFNSLTQRYELQVPAEAIAGSSNGNVGPNRIVKPLRPLSEFDTVFNRSPAIGGRDRETNAQLIERYLLSLLGTSPSVVNGISKILRNQFPNVIDSNVVYGNNTLNIRSATDGGAVDVYVIGSAVTTAVETIVFTGAEQTIRLSKQPITSIISAGTYTQDVDYVLVKDASGYQESNKASDGIRWKSSGTIPAIGSSIVVTYNYNALIPQLYAAFTSADKDVPGRSILFKQADQVNIVLAANLRVRATFSTSTVLNAVRTAVLDYINALKLGQDVEQSDIQAVVRSFTGVDNFVFTTLARIGSTGVADITIGASEFARLSNANITITVV